jgi:Mn-dependent DtxR family transcriptional regulator
VALREEADVSGDELAHIRARLARLDRASSHGPWTEVVLRLIAAQPAVRAADLAASLGRETQPFKTDVRKLKQLGLTESLDVGYRLSPRGRTVLARL